MAIGDDILRERLSLREQMLMQQADALDVKASILLVAVTFLATHSMWVLSKTLPNLVLYDQILSVALQTLAGIVLAIHLRVRSYSGVTAEAFPAWRDDLLKTHGESNQAEVERALNEGLIKRSMESIADALAANDRKASGVQLAFWIILSSFCLNLAGALLLIF